MEELIKQVSEKTGISESQARTAVETVVGFLKQRLPTPLAGQVDNALAASGGMVGTAADTITKSAGDALGGIGGLFRGTKE